MRLFINSLAASAGGGLTYIRNVIPQLALEPDVKVTVALGAGLRQGFGNSTNVQFLELDVSPVRRYWFEQRYLPELIRDSAADVLLSTGNFALKNSPIPQILLSRNSIYTSRAFYRDLMARREYRLLLDTYFRGMLARKSVRWADVTVAPSEAFARELQHWTGVRVRSIYHGFDWDAFTYAPRPLAADVQSKLDDAKNCLKLLFVSHYNYYRNFETLIRALPILRQRLSPRNVKLILTCKLAPGENPGAYRPKAAARLLKDLGVSENVLELGTVPYEQLHHLYLQADIYVSPAYAETFAHPLVEAMASALPVVASDIPVHREICRDAALYFDPFSPQALAARVLEIADSNETKKAMADSGKQRSRDFSWHQHVKEILELSRTLVTHGSDAERDASLLGKG
ncbi:MAG TPA: glycosyltransferase family 1 protein [Candidatus Sulfotelmatobacter sp.]|nr:glycosyltransferase family 1 protein [Candidatus Sulfotelmatobacter sp.]